MSAGATICTRCPHPLATHLGPKGGCRMNQCPCTEFSNQPPKVVSEARTITLEIPDGYVLNFQLVPVYVVGEAGPEVVSFPAGGTVVPLSEVPDGS